MADVRTICRPLCDRCGGNVLTGCLCDVLTDSVAGLRSAFIYGGAIRGAIIDLKYHGEFARANHLAELLLEALPDAWEWDVVVPVPLSARRHRERGFNQSELLAKRIGVMTGRPIEPMLLRTRETRQQVGLPLVDRRDNVRGAFAVEHGDAIRDRTVLLIDDVVTTTSTISACADTLHDAGALSVVVLTLARQPNVSDPWP